MNNKVSSLEATLHSTEGKLREAEYELKVARQDADARGSAASKAGSELEGLRRELATERATSGEKIDLLSKSKEELTRQARELEVRVPLSMKIQ
jgi:predicted  nucleic acid-binding Zn-ribbon protein